MTVTELGNGNVQTAAQQAWEASGRQLTGKDLAAMFGGPKERQWRNRITAWESDGNVPLPPVVASGNGTAGAGVAGTGTVRRTDRAPSISPVRDHGKRGSWWQRTFKKRDPVGIALAAVVWTSVAAVSYQHIAGLALLAGAGWAAWVLPLALDAMVAMAIRRLVVGGLRNPVAWAALSLGFIGSAAANVFYYRPDLIDLDQAIIVVGLAFSVSFVMSGWLLERGTSG